MNLCSTTFTTTCQEHAPWITSTFFDPEIEQDRLTTLDYAVDMAIKKMRKMDGTMLIDCIELPLTREADFKTAIDIAVSENQTERVLQNVHPPTTWGLASTVFS